MRPPSLQFQSVIDAFGKQGWHNEPVEGREVLTALFDAYHTRVRLVAQVFTELNLLCVVAEAPLEMDQDRYDMFFELLMRANKQLNVGSLEYDIERNELVFRVSNFFDREKFDIEIISSMVHAGIAEIDRFLPYANILATTAEELLPDLNIERLLMREDIIPPVEGDEDII